LSSNIEKLLDSFLKQKGEKLVINTEEPIYILKPGGQKIVIFKKVLSVKEFEFIDSEYVRIFEGREIFSYQGTDFKTVRRGNHREFFQAPAASFQAEIEPTSMAAEPPPTPPSPPPVPEPPAVPPPPPRVENLDLDVLLRLMFDRNASDLHLTTGCKPMMRIDGDMVIVEEYPEVDHDSLWDELVRISPERNIQEFDEANDTDFAYAIEGLARFRSNIFRDTTGVGAVFRVIPSKILTVEQLSVPWAMVDLCKIPKGLILVTGPTGSGKSTTLAALIDHINATQKKHIITIEDPVEFVHPNKASLVNQREIHTHTRSFKRALRAALREDPDIILVGEMRDLETIAIAIEMAVTGHLVFGTLHTSTAIGTVDRIIDQFPSDQQAQIRTMLADALLGVCAQTLLKRKEKGRVAAYEILVVTNAVSNLIREGKTFQIATIIQTSKGLGMQMINSHLTELVEQGIVTPEEAIEKAIEKENLKTSLKGKGLWNE
jgi:twitching motility protein PilT